MRRIIGKTAVELDKTAFQELTSRCDGLLLDVGTGDGKHALHLARRHPELLVVGLDAAKDNLRKVATKASAKPTKGGTPNLVLVWASAERLPAELRGITELHMLMPWGSLLRGILRPDPEMLRGLADACGPDTPFLVTLNLHAWHPPVPEVGDHPEPTPESAIDELGPALADAGWRLDSAEYLDPEAVDALATSWTRRLNSSRSQLDVLGLRGVINPSQPGRPRPSTKS